MRQLSQASDTGAVRDEIVVIDKGNRYVLVMDHDIACDPQWPLRALPSRPQNPNQPAAVP